MCFPLLIVLAFAWNMQVHGRASRARSSFLRARQHDSTRNAVNRWITHLDTEGNATAG